uniref:Hemerythrin n=6 Tax=Annelida TaxID=6340 RepID=A0A1S6QD06_HETFI|nr:hemerythrin [Boccardia proboscidea]AQV13641.1 hemerythrin [Galathowenia oculata]AQV13668.1 hemerythrin [Heteromastus filiformis]AQV13775.1 hemerythrin [Themiste pyroides]
MPHAIPEPYCWDESFRVFYDQLDEEHKGLFNGIFDCAKNRGDKGKFDSLYALLAGHFKFEEGMMEKAKYSEFSAHRDIHNGFLAKVKALEIPLTDASVDFAKNWLVQHIKDVDFKYKGKL